MQSITTRTRSQMARLVVTGQRLRIDVAISACLLTLALLSGLVGITWSLPSATRSAFYPQDARWYSEGAWHQANGAVTRLYQTAPYESYNPDEGYVLNALSNMKPQRFDFNPHTFEYPSLFIYLTGGVIKGADLLHWVHLAADKNYYISHPDAMGRIYLMGRMLALLFAVAGIGLLYGTIRLLFDRLTATLGALILTLTPLWVRDQHFLLVNVPTATLMIATAALAAWAIRRHSQRSLLGAAFLAGLAMSTKYPGGAILLVVLAAWWELYRPQSWLVRLRLLPLLIAVQLAGFLLGTPYALVAAAEWLRDLRQRGGGVGFPPLSSLATQWVLAQGTILAFVSLAGLMLVVMRVRDWRYRFVALWLLAGLAQRLLYKDPFVRYYITALPPLALCAALALLALRGSLLRRGGVGGRTLWAAVCVLTLLPAAAYTFDLDRLLSGDDVRNQAAAWIAAQLPAGTRIGVFDPLYFSMPPLNAERYEIINIRANNGPPPNAVVFSSLQTVAANGWLARNGWSANGPAQQFRQHTLSLWTWPVTEQTEDWSYTMLDITVYSK